MIMNASLRDKTFIWSFLSICHSDTVVCFVLFENEHLCMSRRSVYATNFTLISDPTFLLSSHVIVQCQINNKYIRKEIPFFFFSLYLEKERERNNIDTQCRITEKNNDDENLILINSIVNGILPWILLKYIDW